MLSVAFLWGLEVFVFGLFDFVWFGLLGFGLLWFALVCFGVVWFFQDRVALYRPGCPGTNSVEQVSLKVRNPQAPTSQVLRLMVCTTTVWPLAFCWLFELSGRIWPTLS